MLFDKETRPWSPFRESVDLNRSWRRVDVRTRIRRPAQKRMTDMALSAIVGLE
jgi:hypothetical protein